MRGKQGIPPERSRIRSQVEVAPLREGPEHEFCARGGRRQRIIVDRKFELPEMSARVPDRALENGKFIGPARDHVAGPGEKHGDIKTIGETLRRLDRDLVAAIDQRDAAAFQRHQRDRRHLFACCGNQRRGFWSRRGGILRPAAGLADVDEGELGLRTTLRDFPKQRLFLGTGNRDRRAFSERLLEKVEVEAAKLVRLRNSSRAATADRFRVERHGLLATANQEARRRTHL